jgi:predicted ester cyclase
VDLRGIFPDLHKTVEHQLAEGNFVATRCTMRGTHRGVIRTPLGTIEPTDRKVVWTTLSIHRFQDGKIMEGWISYDPMRMLQQIGAFQAWDDAVYVAWQPPATSAKSTVSGAAEQDRASDYKDIVRRYVEDVVRNENMARAAELRHPSYVSPFQTSEPSTLLVSFPDLVVSIDEQVAEGNLVSSRCTMRGTHLGKFSGPFGTVEPTGRQVTWSTIAMHHIEDGRIREDWVVYDPMRLLQEVGALAQWPQGPGSARPVGR